MLSEFYRNIKKRVNEDFPGRKGGWEGWEAHLRHNNNFLRVTDAAAAGQSASRTESVDTPLETLSSRVTFNGLYDLSRISRY